MSFTSRVTALDFTIADSETTSAEISLGGAQLAGIYVSSTLRGISSLTVSASPTAGGTFREVKALDNGAAAYSIALGSGDAFIPVTLENLAGVEFFKIVANTAASGGDFTANLALRPVG
jgi:hypothetical protein